MRTRFLLGRVLDLALVLLGVSFIVFSMIRLVPGDAVQIMLGANTEITPERVAELRARVGLDQPLLVQYWDWLSGAARLDFGTSIWTGRPVSAEIAAAMWPTLELTLLATLVGAGLSIPIGAFMARARGSGAEVAVRVGAIAGLTIPSFWLGILSILVVTSAFPGLSVLGYVPFTEDPLGNLQRMVLPVIALSLPMLANLSRLVRSAMLDAMGQDYVRTARAKGASARRVTYVHALRNALIPYVTSVGVAVGYMLGGAIVVEQVFAIPGLGRLVLGAISERNYPLVQATILVMTASFVFVNFAVDLLYAVLDPRVRR
ncbi:ABC transporter permease [Wenxinia saemankumensis]|uniref:Peptide/nickel transport system permease protein n=1 Tax=Wenxinia saemankumensis TaxID=1447782 RepID=A0A1M6A2T3_9RHOB|nr:ABC transporter permease [Wenxinia saemankumensis]SHI30766.1 peptide/nickel transport system permease protein [Wenxinia saemankumensis]